MSAGIYVHLPFCRVHCTYCPFAISTDLELQNAYVDALIRELMGRRRPAGAQSIDSIYFGGGTPSRTSIENLTRLTSAIREHFDITEDAEFSIEANPEDITRESLAAWRDLGVNRVSIGVQSFNDRELEAIGRVHDAARAREAITLATASGIRTNFDLILGLPQQDELSFEYTLEQALALQPGHLSLYMLDLEEGTPLHAQVVRGRVEIPEDDLVARLYARALTRFEEAGLRQYEISNFARVGEECRHNLRYWRRGEYFGFGLGAHSFVAEERFANTRNIKQYIDDPEHARDFRELIGEDERKRERLFLGLRQASGMYYGELKELCGQEATEWIERGLRDGWLKQLGERVAFTPSGFLMSNDYISQLF